MRDEEPSAAGSTATTVLITADKIYCANVGDSRTICSRNGKTEDLSVDHKPENEKEKARILAAGGEVKNGRIWCETSSLAVSRSLGDFKYKDNEKLGPEQQLVSNQCEVKVVDKVGVEFLLLSCDGVWDVLKSEDAAEDIHMRVYDDEFKTDRGDMKKFVDRTKEFVDCVCAERIDPENREQVGTDNISGLLVEFK